MPIQPALKIVDLRVSAAKQRARIDGRRQGILAALAQAMGIGSTHSLIISPAGVRKSVTGFIRESETFIPLAHVSAVVFQTNKPFEWLAAAVGAFFASSSAAGAAGNLIPVLIGLLIAILFIAIFFLGGRRTTLGVLADAGPGESMRFKASAAEIDDLREVAELLETLLQGERTADTASSSRHEESDEEPPRRSSHAVENDVVECEHCHRRMHVSPAHRGKQVRCPSCKNVMQL